MANKPRGTIIEVWVIAYPAMTGPRSILGVFSDREQAADYVAHEASPVHHPFFMAPVKKSAFKWDDSDQVSLFDDPMFGPYELSTGFAR